VTGHEAIDVQPLELAEDLDPAPGIARAHPRVHLDAEEVADDGHPGVGQHERVALGVTASERDGSHPRPSTRRCSNVRVGGRSSTFDDGRGELTEALDACRA